MVLDKRNLHLRLQEYCDCYMETDFKKELETISRSGVSADVTEDPEEVAVKFVGLAILYGLEENAKRISVVKGNGGEVQVNVEAAGKYKLPQPSSALADRIIEVMHSITHVDSDTGRSPLALGLRNDNLELGVEFNAESGKKWVSISFPSL
jgi:hypothetical protein